MWHVPLQSDRLDRLVASSWEVEACMIAAASIPSDAFVKGGTTRNAEASVVQWSAFYDNGGFREVRIWLR